jgi:hypothetical protein
MQEKYEIRRIKNRSLVGRVGSGVGGRVLGELPVEGGRGKG